MKLVLTFLVLISLFACVKHERVVREVKREEAVIAPQPQAQRISIVQRYTYGAAGFEDPFSEAPQLIPDIEEMEKQRDFVLSPDIHTLKIKGVIVDGKEIYVLFDGSFGTYILKNEKMYDINLRPVTDIKAEFDGKILILNKNQDVKTFDISKWN